ncbi:GlcG/HbpS family heme-binding protein [Streptomyces sp. NPDC002514]|uniref:GlcG/HbpS family heme-binding protein n=1 Tax=Streptomyces sp. NPDC001270 TaxID=3364554 RepID=UPI0036D10AFD
MLQLNIASKIADLVLEEGRTLGVNPLTVAVLDSNGHVQVLKRDNGSNGMLRPQIAQAKAWGAVALGHGGRLLANRAEMAPAFFAALDTISHGRVAPVPGGVLIRDTEGQVIGGVGISGDLPDNDEKCAVAAVAAAGFTPDAG